MTEKGPQDDEKIPQESEQVETPGLAVRSKAEGVTVDDGIVIDEHPLIRDTKGEHQKGVRAQASAKIAQMYQAYLDDLHMANYNVDSLLAVFNDGTLKKGVDMARDQTDLIAQIAELNKLFKEISGRLRSIISLFLVPFDIDSENGRPPLSTRNAALLKQQLGQADQNISFLHKNERPKVPVERFLPPPNQEIIGLIERLYEEEDFLDNPANVVRIFRILDAYLRAVIRFTGVGLVSNVYHTSDQIRDLVGIAHEFHEQAEAVETFGLDHDQETVDGWNNFLFEIELVLAESVLRTHAIYGANRKWLIQGLDLRTIRREAMEVRKRHGHIQHEIGIKDRLQEQAKDFRPNLLQRVFGPGVQKVDGETGTGHQYGFLRELSLKLSEELALLTTLARDREEMEREK